MTIEEERAAAEAERAAELRRRWTAACVGSACAIAATLVLLTLMRYTGRPLDGVLRSLVALLIAMALVLGARALDGPVKLKEDRRGQAASSPAAAAVMLWLGCFAAIMAAFLVSDLVARIDASVVGNGNVTMRSGSRAGSGDRKGGGPDAPPGRGAVPSSNRNASARGGTTPADTDQRRPTSKPLSGGGV